MGRHHGCRDGDFLGLMDGCEDGEEGFVDGCEVGVDGFIVVGSTVGLAEST